jgi:hypothetical protein
LGANLRDGDHSLGGAGVVSESPRLATTPIDPAKIPVPAEAEDLLRTFFAVFNNGDARPSR